MPEPVNESAPPALETGVETADANEPHPTHGIGDATLHESLIGSRFRRTVANLRRERQSWTLQRDVNFFDALTAVVAIAGTYLLLTQVRQTDRALQMTADEIQKRDAESATQSQNTTKQLQAARDSADAAAKAASAAEESARAMKVLAEATVESNRILLRANELDQRAHIVFDMSRPFNLTRPLAIGSRLQVILHLRNIGKTPAREYLQIASVKVEAASTNHKPDYPDPPPPERRGIIAPGSPTDLRATGPALTTEQIDALNSGRTYIFYYGHVRYQDVYGTNHYWRFCRRYNFVNAFIDNCDSDIEEETRATSGRRP